MKESLYLHITGYIQGVGFRPTISHIATSLHLKGYVKNKGNGVEILLQGKQKEHFLPTLKTSLPKIARIHSIHTQIRLEQEFFSFSILASDLDTRIVIPPIPDIAICEKCLDDILNPNTRRYFYPLTNCTHCGPRFSVIKSFPYDRERTSMQAFMMCEDCLKEYQNINNRFFHAQPISCPKCHITSYWMKQERSDFKNLFQEIARYIKSGEIVCIQGIGGFHLLCDATNLKAIKSLRNIKNRPHKPLAIMCKDLHQAKQYAQISPKEQELLQSKEAPIVLLEAKQKLEGIARNRYGIMLAYTPIHKLLFEFLDIPLVATSANFKGEPIIYHANKAHELTPYLFFHQREIINPIEDSIVQVINDQVMMIRNARGYAPMSFMLEKSTHPILAMGANQKSSFAIAFDHLMIISPYIGDLNHLSVIERYKQSIKKMQELYHIQFEEVICDLHPQYISTQMANEFAPLVTHIQHHYAHALSVCFEHNITHKVLGFCFDGTGYAEDGMIWGGEVMSLDTQSFQRLLHFKYFPLLGGEVAIKDIWRNFFALITNENHHESFEEKNDSHKKILEFFISRGKKEQELKTLEIMRSKKINAPYTSSVGRIFDAIAWVCGLEMQSYEGESGEFLESLYDERVNECYMFKIDSDEIILDIHSVLKDALLKLDMSIIASKFLNTFTALIIDIAMKYPYDIVLCGGVFCNKILSSKVLGGLKLRNKKCYIGEKISPNDNGIAIGQLYYMLQRRKNAR